MLLRSVVATLIIPGVVAAAPQPISPPSIDRLIAASNAICVAPETYGFTLGGSAAVGAQATLPKLIGKLLSLGLSTSVKTTGEVHRGIAQRDVGGALTARNACAENVFVHLFDRFYLTDISTGKNVPRPTAPRVVFKDRVRAAQTAPANQQSTILSVGTNSGIVVQGNPNFYLDGAVPKVDHKEQVATLAVFVKQANLIANGFADTNDVAALRAGYAEWFGRVDAYLTAQFDPSYSAQFEAAQGDAIGLVGRSADGNGLWSAIRAKNNVLTSMLVEMRR